MEQEKGFIFKCVKKKSYHLVKIPHQALLCSGANINLWAGSPVLVGSPRVLALSDVFSSQCRGGRGLGSCGDLPASLLQASSRPVAVPAPTESQGSQAPSKCFIPTVYATWEKPLTSTWISVWNFGFWNFLKTRVLSNQ